MNWYIDEEDFLDEFNAEYKQGVDESVVEPYL